MYFIGADGATFHPGGPWLGNCAEGSTGKELQFLGYDSGDYGKVSVVLDDGLVFFLLHGFNFNHRHLRYVSRIRLRQAPRPKRVTTTVEHDRVADPLTLLSPRAAVAARR